MIRSLTQMLGLVKNEEGQGMVEYALILGGIAIIVMVAINLLGTELTTLFTTIKDAI